MAVKDQYGMVAESVYGTPVTVTRFLEFLDENIAPQVETIRSMGAGSRRTQRNNLYERVITGYAGTINYEVMTKGYGLLLQQALGSNVVTQVGATAEYEQVITPDLTNNLRGVSATVQIGRMMSDQTVQPFTFEGGKALSWELSCAEGESLRLALEWDFEDAKTATALAVASFAAGRRVFHWAQGVLTIGGVANVVKKVSLKGNNALDTDRDGIGTAGLKREPLANGELELTGGFDVEFVDMVNRDAWLNKTEAALQLVFTGGLIPSTANPYKLTVDVPVIVYEGAEPASSGPELNRQDIPFRALDNGSDDIVTITINSDDTAA